MVEVEIHTSSKHFLTVRQDREVFHTCVFLFVDYSESFGCISYCIYFPPVVPVGAAALAAPARRSEIIVRHRLLSVCFDGVKRRN